MKIAVIIAEFNPFHKGHQYLIEQTRALTDCTHIVVIQSGNFTQRAEPAIMEKHYRAQAAIQCGVDAVIEMPTAFATGNAEVFAKAGVQLANTLPHSSYLVFGVEDNNLKVLQQIAAVKLTQSKQFEKSLKEHLKLGMAYELAEIEVIKKLLPQISPSIITRILNGGNNILAIEYLRELYRLHSSIRPVPITRHRDDTNTTSALAIRNAYYDQTSPFEQFIPESVLPLTLQALTQHPERALFESATLFNTLTKLKDSTVYNNSPELTNLFHNRRPVTYQELGDTVPTRRYSISRVKRLALHTTLGILESDIKHLYKNNHLPYTNLLAIRSDADEIFRELSSISTTPVIMHGNKNKPRLNQYCLRLLAIDQTANALYEISCQKKFANKPLFVRL